MAGTVNSRTCRAADVQRPGRVGQRQLLGRPRNSHWRPGADGDDGPLPGTKGVCFRAKTKYDVA